MSTAYILHKSVALRSWRLVPYACYIQGHREAIGLTREEYELLSLCDGQHDLPDSPLLADLVRRGMAVPCEKGETLTQWQKPRTCDNRYVPAMMWLITGRCNYNCLHCFNASDNARLQSEFSLDEAMRLIEQADKCGINAFVISGGEPLIHPHLMEILEEIHRRGMFVEELNTNGVFITQELLDRMKAIGCRPMFKMSFDGVGHHDWLRNHKGAEEEALRGIRLCVENGFRVKVHTNVHRLNIHTMLPTLKLMDSIGVWQTRIIRTSEGPRWKENAGDACLSVNEYYDGMLELAREYCKTDCKMRVNIWSFMDISPRNKTYHPEPIRYHVGQYRDNRPVCQGNRGMVAISAEGELVPCQQMSGYYAAHGWHLGNVKTGDLQSYLQEGCYMSEVCTSLGDLKTANERCGSCPAFPYCAGGCRALALAFTDNKLGSDLAKCVFFWEGYLEKMEQAMEGYTSTAQQVHDILRDAFKQ